MPMRNHEIPRWKQWHMRSLAKDAGLPRACGPRNDAARQSGFHFYRNESPVHRGVIARSEATWQSGSSGCSCCLS